MLLRELRCSSGGRGGALRAEASCCSNTSSPRLSVPDPCPTDALPMLRRASNEGVFPLPVMSSLGVFPQCPARCAHWEVFLLKTSDSSGAPPLLQRLFASYVQKYEQMGLHLEACENPVEAGILHVRERMSSGRLKVFASLSKYLAERRLYRRDERDQIVPERDSLQDAVRCLINGISRMRTRRVRNPSSSDRPYFGDLGWMK